MVPSYNSGPSVENIGTLIGREALQDNALRIAKKEQLKKRVGAYNHIFFATTHTIHRRTPHLDMREKVQTYRRLNVPQLSGRCQPLPPFLFIPQYSFLIKEIEQYTRRQRLTLYQQFAYTSVA